MARIEYPPDFQQRVIAQEAAGDGPETLSVVMPSVVAPGRPFAVKIAALDKSGFPSVQFDGEATMEVPSSTPIRVPFAAGKPAIALVRDVTISSPGFVRIQAELDGRVFHSNPALCTEEATHGVYWGDPHIHTVLSACHADKCRSLNFCYSAARYLSGLDWASAADHVSNGRCNFSKWKEQMTVCDLYDDPPDFATVPAYEASLKGHAGGDNNVYLAHPIDMFVDEYEEGSTKTICEKLAEKMDRADFFIVPHHTTRTGKHGEIGRDIYPGEELMPVVEIHSKWGTSEFRGNPNPLQKIHPGPSYVVDLLNQGLKLGFVGGTDAHTTMTWENGTEPPHIDRFPGITAVRAPELTRRAIFDGIRQRNCYAASLERIYLDVSVAGEQSGQSLGWDDSGCPREITVRAAGRSDVTKIEVVRNGDTVHERPVEGWHADVSYTDEESLDGLHLRSEYLGEFAYYYVRVTCASGAQAWSSPVWLLRS